MNYEENGKEGSIGSYGFDNNLRGSTDGLGN